MKGNREFHAMRARLTYIVDTISLRVARISKFIHDVNNRLTIRMLAAETKAPGKSRRLH